METPLKPLLRSRTSQKPLEVKMEKYKARDWDYQNIKHQIIPQFKMGKSKKRAKNLAQGPYTIFNTPIKPYYNHPFKRELKPSIYRSYVFSQLITVPGAVKVEESKIKDDQSKENRIRVVRNNNLCYLNKLLHDYDSNVAFLPGSKKNETKKEFTLEKSSSCYTFNFKKPSKKPKKEEKKINEVLMSPQKNKIKRNKKKGNK